MIRLLLVLADGRKAFSTPLNSASRREATPVAATGIALRFLLPTIQGCSTFGLILGVTARALRLAAVHADVRPRFHLRGRAGKQPDFALQEHFPWGARRANDRIKGPQ
jgi:hypothetical protein